MKWIVTLLAVVFMAGCTITAKEPRDELVARNAALSAEVISLNNDKDLLKYIEAEVQKSRTEQEALLNLIREKLGGARVQPVIQTQPQVIQAQPQVQPQIIYLAPPQAVPSQQAPVIYMQKEALVAPQQRPPVEAYPYPFVPSCGCPYQPGQGGMYCPCPVQGPSIQTEPSKQ